MFVGITYEKIKIVLVETLKRKLLETIVDQVVRLNQYKSMINFSLPYLFIFFVLYLFPMYFLLSISLLLLYLHSLLLNIYLFFKINLKVFIVQIFCNWISIFNQHNSPASSYVWCPLVNTYIYIFSVSLFFCNIVQYDTSSTCIVSINTKNLHLDWKLYISFHCVNT